MQGHSRTSSLQPGNLLVFEDWANKHKKPFLVLSTTASTAKTATCIDGGCTATFEMDETFVETARAISSARTVIR